MQPATSLSSLVLTLAGCASIVIGCGGKTDSSSASTVASTCEVGAERCDCYRNGTCDAGLTCASNVCVKLATSTGGTAGTGGSAPASGGTGGTGDQLGGTSSIGFGGTAPQSGGVATTGGIRSSSGGVSGGAAGGARASSGGAFAGDPATNGGYLSTQSGGSGGNAGALSEQAGAAGAAVCNYPTLSPPLPTGASLCLSGAAKAGACTNEGAVCYKPCGPTNSGWKSLTCIAGIYAEVSVCVWTAADYSAFRVPAATSAIDPSCPYLPPQANAACAIAPCVACAARATGSYLDSTGVAKLGWCTCVYNASQLGKWSCGTANTTWPCPGQPGC